MYAYISYSQIDHTSRAHLNFESRRQHYSRAVFILLHHLTLAMTKFTLHLSHISWLYVTTWFMTIFPAWNVAGCCRGRRLDIHRRFFAWIWIPEAHLRCLSSWEGIPIAGIPYPPGVLDMQGNVTKWEVL